ncbi:MAG: hypothetical protein ACRD2C_00905 [Acidimicrobiales bacterium]
MLVVVGTILAEESVLPTILGLFGGALVSAAVVTLALGELAVRETTEQVDSAVLRGLQDVLEPIRDPVFAGSLVAYRWDCHLACPPAGDPHPDYAYQSMRISYRVDKLPNELGIMCAASRDDRALDDFRADDYILRWLVDDDLDPSEPTTFSVGDVQVDNEGLRARSGGSAIAVPGGQARVTSYPVPRWARQTTGHTVQFHVHARKHVASETRLRIQAQLFRSVTDAEYRLTIDPGLNVSRLWPSASEVSAIGVAEGGRIGSTFPPPFDTRAAIVHLPFPLQPGSTVAFLLDRELSP